MRTRPWTHRARAGLLGAALWLSGCLGGQTGTEIDSGEGGGQTPTTGEPGRGCGGTRVVTTDTVAGFSIDEAVDRVNATPTLALSWDGGGVTDVTLRVAPSGDGCLTGTTLEVPVLVSVETGDGRVSVTRVTGTLRAIGAPGRGLESVVLAANATCSMGAPSSWSIACGVYGFDLAGTSGVELAVAMTLDAAGTRGTVEVLGLRGGGCTGGSDGSCSSPIRELLEGAQFSSP